MSGVASKFRQTLSKALSLSDVEDDGEKQNSPDSIIGKSVNFFSKFSQHSNNGATNGTNEKRLKTLLVIDGKENHWARLFKGHTLHNHTYDIRVEQATLNELQIVSSSEKGASVSMKVIRNGTVVARSFKPDFVLIREYVQGPDTKSDFKTFLLGLIHGLVPAVNSLFSAYNFLEKPIVYAELLKIRNRLGKENFPLVDQNYYQSFYEMLLPPSLPVVVKVGNGHSGYGKVCVASPRGFQDVASLVSMTNSYATSESFLICKFDLRIIKIGQRYKVFKRRSLTDSWKLNTGASSVEEIALTERYKNWADECSTLFGGLDIVCVDAIHTKDDREYIVEVNNIAQSPCPEKKEDDMRTIMNLVIKRMEQTFTAEPDNVKQTSTGNSLTDAIQLISGPPSPMNGPPLHAHQNGHHHTRPESAPPQELNNFESTKNTFKKQMNGSTTSLTSDTTERNTTHAHQHTRKNSFAGRIFSALE